MQQKNKKLGQGMLALTNIMLDVIKERESKMDIYTYLNQFDRVTKDPTLHTMEWIMEEFNHPEKKNKFIHIAGTNGKGSVCEMITNILVKAGYKVGKFISPYLENFNEQITINHIPITDEEIDEILTPLSEKIDEYKKEHEVKWFEITSSMALLYFAKKNCDFVIMETGLGGINDCTNIIDSDISIITSIGYDHMDILGDTIEKIATHKAGIIKENADTICCENCNGIEIVKETCKKKHARLYEVKKTEIKDVTLKNGNQVFTYQNYPNVEVNLKGKKQLENASICLTCMDILKEKGYEIEKEAIYEGLRTVVHPGRFELLKSNPNILFDGGHNEQAIRNLKDTLEQYEMDKKKCYIFSILRTKDYQTVLTLLMEDKEAIFIFTDGNDKNRYVAKEELYEFAKKIDGNENRIKMDSLEKAIQFAQREYPDRIIAIVGSFYIYQDVKTMLKEGK